MDKLINDLISSYKPTILIVDDSFINIQVMSHILQSEPYNIITARTGGDAIVLAHDYEPDLILLDVIMPLMNGFEVAEKLKSDDATKNIPILFVTCKSSDEEIKMGYQLGADDYVTKPFNAEELKKKVKTHLALLLLKKQIDINRNKLEQLVEEKNDLVLLTIHDLKNPIYNILALSKILRDDDTITKLELKEYSQAIVKTSDKTLELIKNLIEISQLEEEKMTYSQERFDVSKIIENILENYKYRAREKEIQLNYECNSTNTEINADPKVTYRILDNLVSNVLKYSPKGKNAYIKLLEKNGFLQIEVKDEGPGFTEEDRKKLFSKFANLSSKPSCYEFTSGLGLSVVKKYVESMNGRVWAESEKGKGAKFVVQLPKIVDENM